MNSFKGEDKAFDNRYVVFAEGEDQGRKILTAPLRDFLLSYAKKLAPGIQYFYPSTIAFSRWKNIKC